MMKIETLEALLEKRVGCLEIAGEGTLFGPPCSFKTSHTNKGKSSRFPTSTGPVTFSSGSMLKAWGQSAFLFVVSSPAHVLLMAT